MSSYLVAIVVGDFVLVDEYEDVDGVKVGTLVPPAKKEQGRFAMATSAKALKYYSDFFNVRYPLPKYESIALADFQCGAMENWGLVTYRESCVLVDPVNSSSASRQWVAIVVNHEMAHQGWNSQYS